MSSVRVVIEGHRDGDWELRTSDLPELLATVGEDVVTGFCACFVHADRLASLVAFLHISRSRFKRGSVAEQRNFLTFAAFVVGTLKEISENLKSLKSALYASGILDRDLWTEGLGRWQKWGSTGAAATARKKLSFHVDQKLVARGLRSLSESQGRRSLIHGSTGKLRDSAFLLGQDAILRGLELTLGSLKVLGDPAELLDFTDQLELEFLRVLEVKGLKPIRVRTSGRPVSSGA